MRTENIVAIIPARGGSKGIPGKNIMDFCGQPLLGWTIQQAFNSKHIKGVFVTSDSEEILTVARKYGAQTILRPKEMAKDSSLTEESLKHASDHIESKSRKKIDLVVFLQVTSPLRTPTDIDRAIECLWQEKADSLFSASILEDYTLWEKKAGKLVSLTFDYKKRLCRQYREPLYLENGSIYLFKPDVLRKYNNRFGGKISVYFMPTWQSYEIDSVEDIEVCSYYMQEKIIKQLLAKVIKDIHLIVYDFDGVMTDNRVLTFTDGREAVSTNRGDGLAVSIIRKMGIPQIILSTEKNEVVKARARKIGIPVLRGIDDKKHCLVNYCRQKGYNLDHVLYIGNDLNDLAVMELVGFPVCPADACLEIKHIARLVLEAKGGRGVIRNLLSYIIRETKK